MSQPGCFLTIDDIKEPSWALLAVSAINHSGDRGTGADGIMAASTDIESIILNGGMDDLFMFPGEEVRPGLYLWRGRIEEDGEAIGTAVLLHPSAVQHWLDISMERA